MRHVWPPGGPPGELDRAALAEVYAYPAHPARPFVRVNFVASADGAVADAASGLSGGLAAPGDRQVFGLLRELADVVLAGAGTVRTEGYRGVRTTPGRRARRRARGQAEVPPVAVVTTTASAIGPDDALLTDTAVPPLLLTTASAAEQARRRLGGAAEVVALGEDDVAPAAALGALADRGLHRVLCEGGPTLFGAFAAAGLVDELCLSLAPQLAGAGPGRILDGPAGGGPPTPLRLASAVAHDDALLLRYRTARGDAADPP
ncbi:pyrimidine reductase family protein [Actinomycetospora sp. TBRC 11914]|uniref:pyrimidine reductase family protein n=1 Tax=Actinomycetospora sp. TBRC 11914 TaxID=2729387 RepID=UPI00145C7460|nr:pyrimidine reductase family protein [Actinomycetospora sp. TBRC 11914]NMO90674.1 pyrimidine reductase family protein [Actinomycetospora sp. TBRC 11914]